MEHQDLTSPTSLPLFREAGSAKPTARKLAGTTVRSAEEAAADEEQSPPAAAPEPPRTPPPAPVSAPPEPAPVSDPADSGLPALEGAEDDVDWTLVQQIRTDVAEQLREQLQATGRRINRDDHEPLARRLIQEHLAQYNAGQVQFGNNPMPSGQVARTVRAVLNSIFGLGRFEELLSIEEAEDIYVRGHDNVIVSLADGRKVAGRPVASSNEELIRELQHIAANNPNGEAKFSQADPQMDITLPDGSRLSASAWFTPYPTVTIRRHRYTDISLADLVKLGALDDALAQFLTAAMHSGKSVVIAGVPGSGKTTMARALLNELDPSIPLATIETNYELLVHELRHRHHNVWATQTRDGGEGGAGKITSQDLVRHSLRQSTDFIVLGEVRGNETLDMLDAMQVGYGSLSTVHGFDTKDAVARLSNMTMRAGDHITAELAHRTVATSVDLIVSIRVIDQTAIGGRKHRFVQAVDTLGISGDSTAGPVSHGQIFVPGPDGRAMPNPDGVLPSWIEDLVNVGFDTTWLTPGASHWKDPLGALPTNRRAVS